MLPNEFPILLSYCNTLLRDRCPSLVSLCEELDVDEEELLRRFQAEGYTYDGAKNAFIPK